ncbi:hypothetical protein HT031_006219 [Scenedesmus sp. PABB004]|nr:hypothetical protein HT031_006219 [Scenedesmus sp. PABB004]
MRCATPATAARGARLGGGGCYRPAVPRPAGHGVIALGRGRQASPAAHAGLQQRQQEQQQRRRRGRAAAVAPADGGSELWTPQTDAALRGAASQLRGLVDALPELPDEVQGGLAVRVPGLLELPPAEVRARLEALAGALGLGLAPTARLISKVPLLWNRSPEAAAAKLGAVGAELGVGGEAAAALLISAPALASVNMPGVVRERVERVGDALGTSTAQAAESLGRQPMLWVVGRGDVRSPVPALASSLGLSAAEAAGLVERMPVLLACETAWLRLNVTDLAASSGLPRASLVDLLARYPALAALPAGALAQGFEELASALEVSIADVAGLVAAQPTLLLAKPPAILGAMDVLCAALRLPSPSDALALLVCAPGLLYDITPASVASRLEQLAVVLADDAEAARAAALRQPALLVVPASALQQALASAAAQLGRPSGELRELLLSDPGALLGLGYMGGPQGQAETWAARLGLDPQAVAVLVSSQPGLLDLPPTTLRARLESLGALLEVPAAAAAQLVLKHAGLAAVPPNATITRAKGLSIALRCSLARAAELVAKVPALLAVPAALLGPGAVAGTPVDTLLDVCATYEFYTSSWIMAAAKERAPSRMTSFAGLHGPRSSSSSSSRAAAARPPSAARVASAPGVRWDRQTASSPAPARQAALSPTPPAPARAAGPPRWRSDSPPRPDRQRGAAQMALLVLLLLASLLPARAGVHRHVPSQSSFLDALRDQSVDTVVIDAAPERRGGASGEYSLAADYSLAQELGDRQLGAAPINITRNVTLTGAAGRDTVLDFAFKRSLLHLCASCVWTFSNITIANERRGNGFSFDAISGDPGSVVHVTNTNKHRLACTAVRDWAPVIDSLPRSPLNPGADQPQRYTFKNVTFQGRDFPMSLFNLDVSVATPVTHQEGVAAPFGGYAQWGRNVTRLCASTVPLECMVHKSPDLCVNDAIDDVLAAEDAARRAPAAAARRRALAIGLAVPLAVAGLVAGLLALLWVRRRARRRAEHKQRAGAACDDSSGNCTSLGGARAASWTVASTMTTPDAADCANRITFGKLLGSGSYGRVYLATWGTPPGAAVAVKVIEHDAASAAAVAGEVATQMRFQHPNIVRALHCVTFECRQPEAAARPARPRAGRAAGGSGSAGSGGRGSRDAPSGAGSGGGSRSTGGAARGGSGGTKQETWLVQELCDLGSLAARLPRVERLASPGEPGGFGAAVSDAALLPRLLLLRDATRGLAALHGANTVHGDLNARNVLVASCRTSSTGMVAKLCDLGLSRVLKAQQTHRSTQTCGTLTHMPPEVLREGRLSPAADIYALGIMAWEVFTGQTAFKLLHSAQVFEAIMLRGERPPLPPGAPADVAALLGHCWAADPGDRPSAAAVLECLCHMIAARRRALRAAGVVLPRCASDDGEPRDAAAAPPALLVTPPPPTRTAPDEVLAAWERSAPAGGMDGESGV